MTKTKKTFANLPDFGYIYESLLRVRVTGYFKPICTLKKNKQKMNVIWNKFCCIFDKLNDHIMSKVKQVTEKTAKKEVYRNPEIGSGLVRIAHKISSVSSQVQVVKIGEKYFRVRELG